MAKEQVKPIIGEEFSFEEKVLLNLQLFVKTAKNNKFPP